VPVVGLSVNHAALSLTDQFNVPVPVLLILRAWLAGFAPPAVAVKLKLVGLTPIVGLLAGGLTVKVTGTDKGELVAPVAVTVITPL